MSNRSMSAAARPILAAAALSLACLATACASNANATAGHSSATVSACDVGVAADAKLPARLTIRIRTEPAARDSAIARLRVQGEDAYRADTEFSAAAGTDLQLRRGTYDLRIALANYEAVVARATLTAGCNAEVVATLRK